MRCFNRPPKKKGNPIITRYPPPPGYKGPAQPQGPSFQNQYQVPQPAYPPGYSAPPSFQNPPYAAPPAYPPNQGYSPQGYTQPQTYPQQPNYPQQGFPPGQNYQYPQQTQPPSQTYPQPPGYPPVQNYNPQQSTYPAYQPKPAHVAPPQQPYTQAPGWQAPTTQLPFPPNPQYNTYGPPTNAHPNPGPDPSATPTPTTAQSITFQNHQPVSAPLSTTSEHAPNDRPELFLGLDDWDFDFDGPIWPKSNEPTDPNLSLGVIIWRPAKPVTRALPSTFEEAEEQALKPSPEKIGYGESVSIYFTPENASQSSLSIRKTAEWRKIKKDPIFVVFPPKNTMDLIPIEDCISKRDRPDEPIEEFDGVDEEDEEDEEDKAVEVEESHDSSWNVMDNLEQALSGEDVEAKPQTPGDDVPEPRDQAQEDILAMLGVTGSPKPPSDDPFEIPSPGVIEKPPSLPNKPPVPIPQQSTPKPPAPPSRAHSYSGQKNFSYETPVQRPYGSMSATSHSRPQAPQERSHFEAWGAKSTHGDSSGNAFGPPRGSPAPSEGSNRTLPGSDFETDAPATDVENPTENAVSMSALHRSDSSISRKRSYDEADQEETIRQQDDRTRRKRRQPQVASAYRYYVPDQSSYITNNSPVVDSYSHETLFWFKMHTSEQDWVQFLFPDRPEEQVFFRRF
ncbi:hypothetical protein P154DRAFT_451023 [Amniculicola lignicola CBS 123094]|uniref:Uncharacterized protein n=1 Tax=Amniculicola lignicola CBS 123094 TaxID=1392246 RepID=A0A6A5VVY9_9PLEO|nr:hypothetical protein P154DRAFT_451023 [Amniculicola lignicola CBS 123094]